MTREFGTLPDNFREVKAALPELSRAERLRFNLETFWICYVEGSIEYLYRGLWLESIRYKLAHSSSRFCVLVWNDDDNHPYKHWYKDVPLNMRMALTDIAGWNFKQRLAFLIATTVKGWKL